MSEKSCIVIQHDDIAPIELGFEPAYVAKYPPDNFQRWGMIELEAGNNVLVTAHTGSGKSFLAEYVCGMALREGKRVIYTSPIKSLSNQKYADFSRIFGRDRVGIMTGDVKFALDAPILIMTTEILHNLLFKQGTATENVGFTAAINVNEHLGYVVFDEIHYINDQSRGHVWENTLIMLPSTTQILGLSATIDGPEKFAKWIANITKRNCALISTTYRVVPLTHCVWGDITGEIVEVIDATGTWYPERYRAFFNRAVRNEENVRMRGTHRATAAENAVKHVPKDIAGRELQRNMAISGAGVEKSGGQLFQNRLIALINHLERRRMLPALCFIMSRKKCEQTANYIETSFLSHVEAAEVVKIWNWNLSRYKSELLDAGMMSELLNLAVRGIAFHHSGVLPILKEIVEILFARGFIRVMFATETFAVGVNMPTKTVIFTELDKPTDDTIDGRRLLKTDEYMQMAGRAGRRGLDDKGTVIYVPARTPVSAETFHEMVFGKRAGVISKFEMTHQFVLQFVLQFGNQSRHKIIEHLAKNIDIITSSSTSSTSSSDNSIILEKYRQSRQQLYQLKLNSSHQHHTPIDTTHIIQSLIHENRQKIANEIAEIEIKLIDYRKSASRGGPAARLYAKQIEITTIELDKLREKYENALIINPEDIKIDLDRLPQSDYDDKWRKHCDEFANHNCGKFDIIVSELVNAGYIAILPPSSHDRIQLDEELQLTTIGIAATEINEIDAIIFIDTIMNVTAKTISAIDLATLVSLLLIDESAINPRDGDSILYLRPEMNINEILSYLGVRETNINISSYDNLMFSLATVLINNIIPRYSRRQFVTFPMISLYFEPIIREWYEGVSLTEICVKYELYEGSVLRYMQRFMNTIDQCITCLQLLQTPQTETFAADLTVFRETILRDTMKMGSLYINASQPQQNKK